MIKRITLEHGLYILVFFLALGVRFLRLGVAPLSDFEAGWALQAWQVSQGEDITLGSEPGYLLLSGLTFFLFGSSNALARFWPAMAGSLMVWLPFLFRNKLGKMVALLLAYGLALDPGLVALSRLAGGPMLALSTGLLAFGLWYVGRPTLAGIFGALALLGGTAVLQGGLGLAVAFGFGKLLERAGILESVRGEDLARVPPQWARSGVIAGGGTILLAGTLFFNYPQGLAALAATVPTYLDGWLIPSGIPGTRLLAALAVYQPMAVIFGIIASVRGWLRGDNLNRWLSLWAFAGLVIPLIYQGRQVGDMAWALVPLWALASLEVARYLRISRVNMLPALGQTTLINVLLILAWLNLAGLALATGDLQVYRLRLAIVGGVIALGVITSGLVALGWSPMVAQRGLVWGLGLALGVYMMSVLWGATQIRSNGEQELWNPAPATRQADLLFKTLSSLSEWRMGFADSLDVVVISPAPSLQWVLRDWTQARFVSNLGTGELPSVIIASEDQSAPELAAAYRGQDFVWWTFPDWSGGLPSDWARWLVFREASQKQDHVILWAKADLFPGGFHLNEEGGSLPIEGGDLPAEPPIE